MNTVNETTKRIKYISQPHFLYLLPVFFVLHGFVENYGLVPPMDAGLLLLTYLIATVGIFSLSYLFFKSFSKAALFAFLILSFHFFFGSLHDWLKNVFPNSLFTRYSFILPLSLIFFVCVFVYLKKGKKRYQKLFSFLNVVFLVFVMIDSITLINRISQQQEEKVYNASLPLCDTCAKPDIYLIVADEYAGEQELTSYFHFDNSVFLNQLTKRGFHVVKNSKSNYNFTPFSMASTLNMSYLPIKDPDHTIGDVTKIMEMIKYNTFTRFLYLSGYQIVNNSVFDLDREPTMTEATFLPLKTVYITSQTFLSRIKKDISFNLITKFKLQWAIKKSMYINNNNNQMLYKNTFTTVRQKTHPKFSYTHLMLPHFPYYFDEDGKPYDYHLLFDGETKERYINYLKYANKKYVALIDYILKNTEKPPIIIFMSDHGFRHKDSSPFKNFSFTNIMSVYLPEKDYAPFYDGMSNVNLFRIILNKKFNQRLPLLKDSTTFLHD